MEIYIVKEGDTIWDIAEYFGVNPERLMSDNQIADASRLVPGEALLVLIPELIHVAAAGEQLEEIAEAFQTTQRQLLRNNPSLAGQQALQGGEEVVVRYRDMENGDLRVMGYVYPYVDPGLLEETVPYLDGVLMFSYGFTREGELLPPENEAAIVQAAWRGGAKPFLVLTPLDEEGRFNNELARDLLQNSESQKMLTWNLLDAVKYKGYAGVDLDFEYILAENRQAYAEFAAYLTKVMNGYGYPVSAALAPKTSAGQRGVLYEGIDYRQLGEAVNWVLLMTYEWGYTYGPPMAVAPLDQVRRVVEYAMTEIMQEKIMMGIPNYGYDWPLPYERGVTRAQSIGNVEAVELAAAHGADIAFDPVAMSPYFHYTEDGVEHEVWFEDVRSILAKVRLAQEKGLKGIGYWNLMRPFRSNWLLLNQLLRG